MTRLRGWSPRGERLLAKVPHGHWKTLTFLAALRSDRIDARLSWTGRSTAEASCAYVEQILVPTLQPGDIVIMDNLGSHKVQGGSQGDPRGRRQAPLPAALSAQT